MWIAIQNAVGARQGVGGGPGPGPGYTPPLDDYTGALVAYSIRKVRSAYSGPAIEAERFSDGATQDIEFDSNGLIDTTALTTFASGSIVGVRTWYDQSGNDNHAVQTAQSNQPRIYDGSNLYKTESGKLYVLGSGIRWWELTTDITTAQSIFDSRITSGGTSVGTNFLFGNTSSYNYHSGERPGDPIYLSAQNSATYVRNGDNYENGVLRDFTSYLHPLRSQVLISMFHTSASGRINELSRDRLGVPGARSWGGFWQETIIYGDNRSGIREAFESNQNTYYQVTNLPDFTSGFLADYHDPAGAYSVRKLSNTAIKALRVRRDVPPYDELDIGFTDAGDLDEQAIIDFGGSDVLRVSRWYDQSGQSRHGYSTASTQEPTIYNGTTVITDNGKPAVQFTAGSHEMNLPDLNSLLGDAYVVSNINPGGGSQTAVLAGQTMMPFAPRVGITSGGLTLTAYKDGTILSPQERDELYNQFVLKGQTLYSGIGTYASLYTLKLGQYNLSGFKVQEVIRYTSSVPANQSAIEANINTYYGIYGNPVAPTSGFLFDYSGAAVAYSVRQLNNNATVALRVRRTVAPFDEQDIGFTPSGDLDTTAISTFGGGDPLTVSRWYDQTGYSRNAGQGTTTLQPLIYNGTAVTTINGRPTITNNGYGNLLYSATYAQPYSYTAVGRAGSYDRMLGNNQQWYQESSNTKILNIDVDGGNDFRGDQVNIFGVGNGTSSLGKVAGATAQPAAVTITNSSDFVFSAIGGRNTTDNLNSGEIQEVIFWTNDQEAEGNRTAIESNINTYYSIYT